MGEIQTNQQVAREPLQVVDKRELRARDQTAAATIDVYGNYAVVDAQETGYSLARLSPGDVSVLQSGPPMSGNEHSLRVTLGEMVALTGTLVYGVVDIARDGASGSVVTYPVTGTLLCLGGMTLGGVGAVARRRKKAQNYQHTLTQAGKAANQNFIPGKTITFPQMPTGTEVKYGHDKASVDYEELWSAVGMLQQGVSSPRPKPNPGLAPREVQVPDMVRGMMLNCWGDEARQELVSNILNPWADLKADLGRMRVYQGLENVSNNVEVAYHPQVIKTAGNLACIVASFLDVRGMELYGKASQQSAAATTMPEFNADQELLGLLTHRGAISVARTQTVLCVDRAYRDG